MICFIAVIPATNIYANLWHMITWPIPTKFSIKNGICGRPYCWLLSLRCFTREHHLLAAPSQVILSSTIPEKLCPCTHMQHTFGFMVLADWSTFTWMNKDKFSFLLVSYLLFDPFIACSHTRMMSLVLLLATLFTIWCLAWLLTRSHCSNLRLSITLCYLTLEQAFDALVYHMPTCLIAFLINLTSLSSGRCKGVRRYFVKAHHLKVITLSGILWAHNLVASQPCKPDMQTA
jgi:hypothetical protein